MNRRMNLLLDDIRAELAPRPDEPPAEDDGTGDEMPEPGEDVPIDESEEADIAKAAKATDELLRLRDLPEKVRELATIYKAALASGGPEDQKDAAHRLLLSAGAYAGKYETVAKTIRKNFRALDDGWKAHKRIVRQGS